MGDRPDLEERVAAIEQLIERAIEAARCHPVGRAALRALGLLKPPRGDDDAR